MSMEEAIEEVVVFEDVYPRRIGTMSDIVLHEYTDKIEEEGKEPVFKKWNAYRFKDTGMTFSKDYVAGTGTEYYIPVGSNERNELYRNV